MSVETKLKDKNGVDICFASLVKGNDSVYIVKYDLDLKFVLFDISESTVEQLNAEVAKELKVIVKDVRTIKLFV